MLLKIIVSLGLIVFLIAQLDFQSVVVLLASLDVVVILSVILIMFMQILMAARRWSNVLQSLNFDVKYDLVLLLLWVGLFFNNVLPSSVGGDLIRGYYLKQQKVDLLGTITSVVLDRMFGVLALVVLFLCSLPFLMELLDLNDSALIYRSFYVIMTIVIVVLIIILYMRSRSESIKLFLNGIKDFFFTCPFCNLRVFFISLCIHLLSIMIMFFLSIGLHIDVSWYQIVLVVPMVMLLTLLPISIGGWGVRESAMVLGMGYVGVAQEEAFALSLAYGLLTLVVSIPGVIAWIQLKRRHSRILLGNS